VIFVPKTPFYHHTLEQLNPLVWILALLLIAPVALAGLASIPATLLVGLGGMFNSRRLVITGALYGVCAFLISLIDLWLWYRFGGLAELFAGK